MRIEQEQWKAEIQRKQQESMQEWQRRLKEEAVKERNKEIAAIIEKLGEETCGT